MLNHMLGNGILAEDEGVLGLGARGEREFGRRYFAELVAAFTEPLLLAVRHGSIDLGAVHPASLTPSSRGEVPILSLGGRSWKVVHIDWRRRAVAVTPADGPGRSRWLGSGRSLAASTCRAAERIVAGAAPGCRLSRRAEAALDVIRSQLPFVDAVRLPIVSDGESRMTIWTFSGGATSSSIAREFAHSGLAVLGFDDFSVSVRGAAPGKIADYLRHIDPDLAHPRLPDNLTGALKFGLCLPEAVAAEVLSRRTADPASVREIALREPRFVSDFRNS